MIIDQPGVYDLTAEAYHADPVPGGSLSSSGARMLLAPSCPALYRHRMDAGQGHRQVFDIGHAAHAEVLGIGAELAVIDADSYRTNAARAERDAAYAAGKTPLLVAEHEQVLGMATALREHPVASELFRPGHGEAEQALFWFDEEFGVWRRAMLDWSFYSPVTGQFIAADYKTTKSAEPDAISRAMSTYGYVQQDPYYLDGAIALGLAGDLPPAFIFVFQEKEPPYLVTICQLNPESREWGQVLNRKALDVYRTCRETGHWPGYSDGVISVGIPGWADRQHQTALDRGDYQTSRSVA